MSADYTRRCSANELPHCETDPQVPGSLLCREPTTVPKHVARGSTDVESVVRAVTHKSRP